MRIVCIADTHQELPKDLPKGDILIHAGDAGDPDELNEYFRVLRRVDKHFRYIIFVPGNHDFAFTQGYRLTNAYTLVNQKLTILGLTFWGSPYTPLFHNWAFMKKDEELREIWDMIPEKLDFLITHGPPSKILDKNTIGELTGSDSLHAITIQGRAKYHIFGHIHEAYGKFTGTVSGTKYVNCSLLNEHYELVNKPVIIDL